MSTPRMPPRMSTPKMSTSQNVNSHNVYSQNVNFAIFFLLGFHHYFFVTEVQLDVQQHQGIMAYGPADILSLIY